MKVYTKTTNTTCVRILNWLGSQKINFDHQCFDCDNNMNDIWVFDNEEDAKKFSEKFKECLLDDEEAILMCLTHKTY